MGLDISFRRISCLLVVGLILLTVSALANAGAALSFPYTQVTEVAKVPVTYDPIKGVGVQTITKTCAASNSCTYKPAVQTIARGASGLGRFVRVVTNPWVTAAMTGASWAWDEVESRWLRTVTQQCWAPTWDGSLCVGADEILAHAAANATKPLSYAYVNEEASYIYHVSETEVLAILQWWWYNGAVDAPYTSTSHQYNAKAPTEVTKVATANDVWDAITSYPDQANSWKIATADGQAINPWKDLFPDAAPVANSDEMPEISPSDARLLDLLKQGLLQTTNPLAPNYVTAENLARLEALQSQLDSALNQKAEDTLNAMKQPLTQQQYDESNARDRAAFVNNLPSANFLPDPQESLNKEIGFIQKMDDTPPSSPDLNLLWGFTTGTCSGFTLPVYAAGHSYSMVVNKQCDWYPIFNAAVNWFLYLLTAFQVFHIFHRMVTRTI